jgi:hypothetical protein
MLPSPAMAVQPPLVAIIPRFIQMALPLLPLKPMGQSRCGVTDFMEARMHLLAMAIPRFIPSALRAAKAYIFE